MEKRKRGSRGKGEFGEERRKGKKRESENGRVRGRERGRACGLGEYMTTPYNVVVARRMSDPAGMCHREYNRMMDE